MEFSTQRVITYGAQGALEVHAADVDGDGDTDVLSASLYDDKIAWYRNEGAGAFSGQRIISTTAHLAMSVHSADIDGDGYIDVLSASFADDKIAWYRNEGDGQFSSERVISRGAEGARSVYAADLDGDGDTDVLSASELDDKVAWYRNAGRGSFSQELVVAHAPDVSSVLAADLDGDGRVDVLHGSDDGLGWHRNEGGGEFSERRSIAGAGRAMHTADLDGDGDVDVVTATFGEDRVSAHLNEGAGTFAAPRVITTAVDGPSSVHTADIDGDGRLDVLSTSRYDEKAAWYRNIGSGRFAAQEVISTDADTRVRADDLDGDGDMDVLTVIHGANKLAWYENDPDPVVTTPGMVTLPAGVFRMGCTDTSAGACSRHDLPLHDVRIGWPFAISETEVTFGQWEACVAAGGCTRWASLDSGWGRGNRPVINLDWEAVQEYPTWLSQQTGYVYRLPSEAEWEYAARAGAETSAYHFGNDLAALCLYANHGDASTDYPDRNRMCADGVGHATAPVRSYLPNAWGLYDMHGNVWEWVADCYNESHAGAPTDGRARLSGDCENRVARGGAWYNPPRWQRVWARGATDATTRANGIGFRVVRELPKPASAQMPQRPRRPLGDFDGDGRDDVLLRHGDGRWFIYALRGTLSGEVPLTRNLEWRLVGLGDLNGDGNDDVLLRHTQGRWAYYPMAGRRVIESGRGWASITQNTDWTFAGMGDLNGDGRDDVLLRHVDGQWLYEPMNGRNSIKASRGWAYLPRSLGWQLAGLGDLNGDGRDDVLLRHANGRWHYYAMRGRSVVVAESGPVGLTSDLAWGLAAIGDMNGDGKDDVLLRHIEGRWRVHIMDGRDTLRETEPQIETHRAWDLVGVGDMNGDGTDDVLLRYADGSWQFQPIRNGRAASVGRPLDGLPAADTWSVPGDTVRYAASAVLAGPLDGADVTVAALADVPRTVHRGHADGRGRFGVPAAVLGDADLLYLVTVSGGRDYVGAAGGAIRAVATRAQLLSGLNIGVLSDIGWRYTRLKPGPFGVEDNLTRLSDIARYLLRHDVSGDRLVDHRDLAAFDPATHTDALAFPYDGLADGSRFEDGISVLDAYRDFDDTRRSQRIEAKLDDLFGAGLTRLYPEDSRASAVTVTLAPFGDGTVRSTDGRIAFDPDIPGSGEGLARIYSKGAADVVFQASPGQGSRVLSWGGCDGTSDDLRSCTVSPDRNRTVEVVFGHEEPIVVDNFADLTGAENTRQAAEGVLVVTIADRDDELLAKVEGLQRGDFVVADGSGPQQIQATRQTGYREYELTTSGASLEDVIEEGTIHFRRTITEGDLTQAAQPTGIGPSLQARVPPGPAVMAQEPFFSDYDGVSFVRSGDPTSNRLVIEIGAGAATGSIPDCEVTPISALKGECAVTVRDSRGNEIARVRGRIELEISMEFGASWGLGKGLESIKVVPEIKATEDLEVHMLAAGVRASREFQIAVIRPAHITFVVGVVPVYLAPVFEISAGVDAKAGVLVKTGIKATQAVRAGFVYQKGEGTSFRRNFAPSWQFRAPSIGFVGSIEPYLKFTGSVFIYGIVGPGVTVQPSITVTGAVSNTVGSSCLEKDAGAWLRLQSYLALETEPVVDKLLGRLVKESVVLHNTRLSLYDQRWPLWDWEKTTCAGRPRIVLEGTDVAATVRRTSVDDSKWGITYRIRNKGQGDLRWDVVLEDEHGLLEVRKPPWADRLLTPDGSHDLAVFVNARRVPTNDQRTATFRVVDAQRRDSPDAETGATARSVSVLMLPPHLEPPTSVAATLADNGTEIRVQWNHAVCLLHQFVPGTDTHVEAFRILRSSRDKDLDDPDAWVEIGDVPAASGCEAVFQVREFACRVGGACDGVEWQKGETYHLRVAAADGHSVAPSVDFDTLTVDWNQVPTFRGATFESPTVAADEVFDWILPQAYGGDGKLTYSLRTCAHQPVPIERCPLFKADGVLTNVRFDPATRRLHGLLRLPPSGKGYDFTPTYFVVDEYGASKTSSDRDSARLNLTIRVVPPTPDRNPVFAGSVRDQSYLVDRQINAWTLPEATGGDGKLRYTLTPEVPGLRFDDANRRLSGTPTRVGTYAMTYRATDEDGDNDELRFSITVRRQRQEEPDSRPVLPHVPDQTFAAGTQVNWRPPAATGGNDPKTYTMASLPPGLTFHQSSRTLTGTPTQAGTWRNVRYEVRDRDGDTDHVTFAITIDDEPPPSTAWITGDWHGTTTIDACPSTATTVARWNIAYRGDDYVIGVRDSQRVDPETCDVEPSSRSGSCTARGEDGLPPPADFTEFHFRRMLVLCGVFDVQTSPLRTFGPSKIVFDRNVDDHVWTTTLTPDSSNRTAGGKRRGIPIFR